jgi:DNA-binding NarL/FixJ family response regulator
MEQPFVTILFTDLVGSAAMFDRHGGESADALRREHFAALRGAVAKHAGREVKTTEAGLMVVFDSAVAAARCAIDMQRAAAERPGLRVGLDAGEPLREGADHYGAPVIIASALCDLAEAGQILASDVVCRIAGPRLERPPQPVGTFKLRAVSERVPAGLVPWSEDGADDPRPAAAAPARPISVVIADDQRLLRAGFKVILDAEPDITVVGEADDGRPAIDLVRRRRPDVVLMDVRMPELDGLRAAEEILADPELDTAVLMLTTFDLDQYVFDALRIGASGFLLKDAPSDRLIDAVRVAAAGDALLAPSVTRRLIERFASSAEFEPPANGIPDELSELTPRELDVLKLVAQGLSNSEIAAALFLTENTVKTHVAHLLAKLELRDRVQAVVFAYESGLAGRR